MQYKQQSRLDEKRKKALDLHLNFIVDQTEKYSSWLTEGLKTSSKGSLNTTPDSSVAGDGKWAITQQNSTTGMCTQWKLPYKSYVLGQIGLSKQCRPRSDCFWRSSLIRVYPVCHSISIFWMINAMLHQTFLFLGQLWPLFEVSQILEFLRYISLGIHPVWSVFTMHFKGSWGYPY